MAKLVKGGTIQINYMVEQTGKPNVYNIYVDDTLIMVWAGKLHTSEFLTQVMKNYIYRMM